MVALSSKRKKPGQPTIADWERWRVNMWAHDVQRRAQAKMAQKPLPTNDPFSISGHAINAKWGTPQRQTQSPGLVTFADLDMIFVGSQKSTFYKYAKGERARPSLEIVADVEAVLPGTKALYEIGPQGIPLWPALGGKISADNFWEPLVMSGQVTDALELLSGGFDYLNEGVRKPQPQSVSDGKGFVTDKSYHAALTYEANVILPRVPWENMVFTLSTHFVRYPLSTLDEPITPETMNVVEPNLGIATLAIAMAHLALNDPNASSRAKACLNTLLIGSIPFWKDFDAASDEPKSEIAVTVRSLASRLQLRFS